MPTQHFSLREAEILRMVAQGMTDKEIAQHLGISVKTVRTHLDRTLRRTGSRNRTAVVMAWMRASASE
ncbi:MAG TPA: helix-turn-helix transcriptional regulator [Candidatus Dormibacteraeota bacterium]|nr:helix-turn-helix transcriptional regulator [Candidatus Dormibacteraeota bacterium]